MKTRIVGASLVMTLLLGSGMAADGLKSGPQTGETIPGAFHPLNVTGGKSGQKNCLV